ncbi:MAG TPA: hypothetical protein VEC13_00815 [Candidatus Paceibacterota bacterium]|nr:hypothetical protein [Candidatus Paceibacterota bacterium]
MKYTVTRVSDTQMYARPSGTGTPNLRVESVSLRGSFGAFNVTVRKRTEKKEAGLHKLREGKIRLEGPLVEQWFRKGDQFTIEAA